MNNQPHNEGIAPSLHGDRKGKGATMARRAWAVVVLLVAGFFLHDAVWHLILAVFGMNTIVGTEFSLPDLGASRIYLQYGEYPCAGSLKQMLISIAPVHQPV